jgi:hypothetical protein
VPFHSVSRNFAQFRAVSRSFGKCRNRGTILLYFKPIKQKKMGMIKKYSPFIAVAALGVSLYLYFTLKDNKDETSAEKAASFLGLRKKH